MDINVRFGKAPRRRKRRAGIVAALVAVVAAVAVVAGKMVKDQRRAHTRPEQPGASAPK